MANPKSIKTFSPLLAPFLQKHVGESYFKRGNFIDNETFETVCNAFAEWFNENKKQLITNISEVYKMTGNETGYDAMVVDWKRLREWKGVGDVVEFSRKDIEKLLIDKIGLVMNHLYQQDNFNDTFNSSLIGLFVLVNLSVEKIKDGKRKILVFDYGVSINIGSSNHTEIEF